MAQTGLIPWGIVSMTKTRFLAGAAALMMTAAPVLAQQTQPAAPTQPARPAPAQVQQPAAPAQPARPAPAQIQQPAAQQPAAPAQPARPAPAQAQPAAPAAQPARPAAATPAAPAAAQGQRVNLNTAGQADLDKLPQIGEARAKAILAERAKGRFRNWDDFVQRMQGSPVNQTAKDAIKDRVSF